MHFFASSDKAKRVLGWKPQHTFKGDVEQVGWYEGARRVRVWGQLAAQAGLQSTRCPSTLFLPLLSPFYGLALVPVSLSPLTSLSLLLPLQLVKDFQASGRLDKQPDFAVDDKVRSLCDVLCYAAAE